MAVFAVYIKKTTDYFGEIRDMGNTYHYLTELGETFNDEEVATQIADAEKLVTSNRVSFVSWSTWGPTDGAQIDNVMREDGQLSGNGDVVGPTSMYSEACSLVTFPMPRSPVENRKRWLRKFLRLGIGDSGQGDLVLAGREAMTVGAINNLEQYGRSVGIIVASSSEQYTLCNEEGTTPFLNAVGDAVRVEVRPYLYTRQIGR